MARPGPIVMLLLVRDEADVIEQNIRFHRHFGIENFVVIDNGSKDGTREILAGLEQQLGKSLVIIDDPEPAHHQSARVNRMIEVAKRKFRPSWIISADADEFWYPISAKYEAEMDGRKNIVNCYWHNFLPHPELHWQEFTDIGEMPGYHGRIKKVFVAARGLFGLYSGNHEARAVPKIESDSHNIRVYHYPVRSYEQFERKVVQGYRATLKTSYEAGTAWHWKEYYEAWEAGRLNEVYADLACRNRISQDDTMAELFRRGAGESRDAVVSR